MKTYEFIRAHFTQEEIKKAMEEFYPKSIGEDVFTLIFNTPLDDEEQSDFVIIGALQYEVDYKTQQIRKIAKAFQISRHALLRNECSINNLRLTNPLQVLTADLYTPAFSSQHKKELACSIIDQITSFGSTFKEILYNTSSLSRMIAKLEETYLPTEHITDPEVFTKKVEENKEKAKETGDILNDLGPVNEKFRKEAVDKIRKHIIKKDIVKI